MILHNPDQPKYKDFLILPKEKILHYAGLHNKKKFGLLYFYDIGRNGWLEYKSISPEKYIIARYAMEEKYVIETVAVSGIHADCWVLMEQDDEKDT